MNLNIFETLLIVFMCYFVFTIIFFIILKISWSKKEDVYIGMIETQQEMLDNSPTLDIGKRVEATKELFSLIDTLIEYEIINNRRYEIFLEKKNKNLDFEEVLKEVGQSVFESLSTNVYTDRDNLVTKECIMKYIQKRAFVEYFIYLKNLNQNEAPIE